MAKTKQAVVKIKDEWNREYQVIKGKIPENYSIWNAGILKIDNKVYLKLYNRKTCINYNVCLNDLLAIEVPLDEAIEIEYNCGFGGRCPLEVKRHLKNKHEFIRKHAEIMKHHIEKLYDIEIKENN